MPLNTPVLKQALQAAYAKLKNSQGLTPEQQLDILCADLSSAFESFVKSGDVEVTVQTTGTAAAQSGTGIGKVK